MFRLDRDTEIDLTLLNYFIGLHNQERAKRLDGLYRAYVSDHDILHAKKKPDYKPDNRIVINFPKFITDTFNGFFMGNPVKITAEDENVAEFLNFLNKYNAADDHNSELSKICSIYGNGYEMYYVDEDSELCFTYLNPRESFMIYDDSIVERPLYFVRRYKDKDNNEWGSISDKTAVRHFKISGGLKWTDEWKTHYFDGVPATEYVENEERQGIFEPVMTPINAYNKAISEKANDVDYFADAYLKILGALLEEGDLQHIRDNRVINFAGDGADKIIAEFMDKPNNDTTQENHLDRLERLIFHISMVANISDENFGASSGTALKYKLQAMDNMAKSKARKFESGMNRRYKLLFNHPRSKVPGDSWLNLSYRFTANIPANMLEEAEIAARVEGITSKKTQLRTLSIVENVQDELDQIEKENEEVINTSAYTGMFLPSEGEQ